MGHQRRPGQTIELTEEVGGEGALYYLQTVRPEICVALELGPHVPDAPVSISPHPTLWVNEGYSAMRADDIAWVTEIAESVGIPVTLHCGGGSFKSQMKKADASGAALAAIVGDDEAKADSVSLKPLRNGEGQRTVSREHVAEAAAETIFGSEE